MNEPQEALATLEIATEGTRSQHDLLSFFDYCLRHPDKRFWQALRDWSDYSFILGIQFGMPAEVIQRFHAQPGVQDTFYLERTPHDMTPAKRKAAVQELLKQWVGDESTLDPQIWALLKERLDAEEE